MIYVISKYENRLFRDSYSILNENGSIEYTLNTTGFILNQILFPNFLIRDHSGKEIMQASKDKPFRRNRHILVQNGKELGIVKETTIHHYIIELLGLNKYEIILSGIRSKKWQFICNEESIAQIEPDWKRWGWKIELPAINNKLFLLVGLALIYNYFQEA